MKGLVLTEQNRIDKTILDLQIGETILKHLVLVCSLLFSGSTTLSSYLLTLDPPLHPSAIVAASFAVAQSAAKLLDIPLHKHFTQMLTDNKPNRLSVPLVFCNVIAGGQLGCGKLKIRSFCLSSLPSCSLEAQIHNITTTYQELGRILLSKPNGVSVCLLCYR